MCFFFVLLLSFRINSTSTGIHYHPTKRNHYHWPIKINCNNTLQTYFEKSQMDAYFFPITWFGCVCVCKILFFAANNCLNVKFRCHFGSELSFLFPNQEKKSYATFVTFNQMHLITIGNTQFGVDWKPYSRSYIINETYPQLKIFYYYKINRIVPHFFDFSSDFFYLFSQFLTFQNL